MKIVIIDTCCANLFSLISAIRRLGYQPNVSHDAKIILQADKLFLPGVGTAHAAMDQLYNFYLIDLVKAITKPILGICLGMQLFGSCSDEGGSITTLGIIKSPVKKMSNLNLPMPHIGWNQVKLKAAHRLFYNIPENSYFYFIHSYAMLTCNATIAKTNYGEQFTAAVAQKNFFGVQFHPERSGIVGQQLLKNFLEM